MSNENGLATWNQTTQLLATDAEPEIKETARKLMKLTPGGINLNANQAAELAVYSFMTGLNPFNSECYYMDKVGPVAGIAGYRVKAMTWLRVTSQLYTTPRIWEEYRPATTEEADFDPDKGDIAWVCMLYDSVSQDAWKNQRIELMGKYKEYGATFQEAYDLAAKDVGPCPHWEAVGVVHADEHFSGNAWENNVKQPDKWKPEMWDRNERAKKRAAKGCFRKGFPQLNIPDAEYGTAVLPADTEEFKVKIIDEIAHDEKEKKQDLDGKSEAQLDYELGFGPAPAPAEIVDPDTGEVAEIPNLTQQPAPVLWDEAVLDALAQNWNLAKPRLTATLKYCKLAKSSPIEVMSVWMQNYKAHRDAGEQPAIAAESANVAMQEELPG